MYVDANTIIVTASVITALVVIFSAIFAVYKWYLKQEKQDKEIARIKDEQGVMCYAMLACLDGLKQLGANGNVTDAFNKLEKHINQKAHE
jgi:predicted negative regulator of RcsB-dependent stress response